MLQEDTALGIAARATIVDLKFMMKKFGLNEILSVVFLFDACSN